MNLACLFGIHHWDDVGCSRCGRRRQAQRGESVRPAPPSAPVIARQPAPGPTRDREERARTYYDPNARTLKHIRERRTQTEAARERASARAEKPWPITLVCEGCARSYVLPLTAVIISAEQSKASLLQSKGIIGLAVGASATQVDGVANSEGMPPERRLLAMVQTSEALRQILQGLANGQERMWLCMGCDAKNQYPDFMRPTPARTQDQPYPSDGWYRDRSRSLVKAHGALVRMTDSGSTWSVKWCERSWKSVPL